MTNEKLYEALGDINEKHIMEAKSEKKTSKNTRMKWGTFAACFAAILIACAVIMPVLLDNETIIPFETSEYSYEKGYFYHVDGSVYSSYIGGKVITEDHIGGKLEDVSVVAGWKNHVGEWISTENLRGEIYAILDVSDEIAVALRFLDQGEAITTTHYYVIMNPSADLSSVEEYIIVPDVPNNFGDEMAGEIPE